MIGACNECASEVANTGDDFCQVVASLPESTKGGLISEDLSKMLA